jgi:hypothetical protein
MSILKKYWPHLSAAAVAVLHFLLPSLSAYTSAHPKTVVGVLLGCVITAYESMPPRAQGQSDQSAGTALKVIAVGLLVLASTHQGFAQVAPPSPLPDEPVTNIYAAGISFNSSGSPSIAGTGLYARLISDGTGTYAFTVVDALPASVKPFTVTSSFGAGIAQKVFTVGNVPIFVPTSAGISYNGSNTGWAWSTGALAAVKIKNNWRIFPNVRIVKSSVSGGTGYQPIVGILFGWGQ